MPFVTSEGANIFLELEGEGTPLLCAHDFGMDHRQWDAQAAAFADELAVFRFDWPGHGQSASLPRGHTRATMGRDLVRIMVQVGMEKTSPGFLVAQGWSADAALRAALAEPRLLRGVVVVSPELAEAAPSDDWRALWDAMRVDIAGGQVAAAFERYRRDPRFDGVRDRPDVFAAVHAMQARCTGASLLDAEAPAAVLPQLGGLKVPLLVIVGERDRDEFRRTARELAATAPQAELHEIPSSGHFPNLEAPVAFETALRAFTTRLTAS